MNLPPPPDETAPDDDTVLPVEPVEVDNEELVAAVIRLATNVNAFNTALNSVAKKTNANKRSIRWMVAGFVLGVLLLIGFGFGLSQSHSADVTARNARRELKAQQVTLERQTEALAKQTKELAVATRTNCINANDARAVNKSLWNFALDAFEQTPEVAAFRVRVDDAFPQEDCDQ